MSAHPGWPASLGHGRVALRPLKLRDATAWSELRLRNEEWLRPWEPTSAIPWRERHGIAAYPSLLRRLRHQGRTGVALPWAVTFERRLAGQLTVGNIVRGAFCSAYAGYWVDKEVAGLGVMPVALALAVDHCFGPVGLHRVEVNVRPENVASRRVVEKLGFREEGYHQRYLSIDGQWTDHIGYALTTEEVPAGLLDRYLSSRHTG